MIIQVGDFILGNEAVGVGISMKDDKKTFEIKSLGKNGQNISDNFAYT